MQKLDYHTPAAQQQRDWFEYGPWRSLVGAAFVVILELSCIVFVCLFCGIGKGQGMGLLGALLLFAAWPFGMLCSFGSLFRILRYEADEFEAPTRTRAVVLHSLLLAVMGSVIIWLLI
jgi:hypothetical protein